MKAVGIKMLKDNLSKYLKLVIAGETIWVTDRDEVIAEIHKPIQPVPGKISPWEAFLNNEERRGSVKRAKGGNVPVLEKLTELPRPYQKINTQKILDELKAD